MDEKNHSNLDHSTHESLLKLIKANFSSPLKGTLHSSQNNSRYIQYLEQVKNHLNN